MGTAYHRVWVRIDPGTTKDGAGNPVGFRLRVWYWDKADPERPVRRRRPSSRATTLPGPEPTVTEDFDDLSLDPASPSYFVKRVNGTNPWPAATRRSSSSSTGADAPRRCPASRRRRSLADGVDDDALTAPDFHG